MDKNFHLKYCCSAEPHLFPVLYRSEIFIHCWFRTFHKHPIYECSSSPISFDFCRFNNGRSPFAVFSRLLWRGKPKDLRKFFAYTILSFSVPSQWSTLFFVFGQKSISVVRLRRWARSFCRYVTNEFVSRWSCSLYLSSSIVSSENTVYALHKAAISVWGQNCCPLCWDKTGLWWTSNDRNYSAHKLHFLSPSLSLSLSLTHTHTHSLSLTYSFFFLRRF